MRRGRLLVLGKVLREDLSRLGIECKFTTVISTLEKGGNRRKLMAGFMFVCYRLFEGIFAADRGTFQQYALSDASRTVKVCTPH